MEKELLTLTDFIGIYKDCDATTDGNTLTECLKQITSALFFLEIERSKAHEKWQGIVHTLVIKQGMTVSRAENEAHVLVPEMYKLRRIMDSGYTTVDAIRTNISWIKAGLNN